MNYIFDIDGTLADCSHRLHFIQNELKDWDAFHSACVDDKPIDININLLHNLWENELESQVLFLTGRPESSRGITRLWFADHTGYFPQSSDLFMRKDGDHREDWVIKLEHLTRLLESEKIQKENTIIFDDRDQVVNALRKNGWTCFQVKKGDY